MSTHSNIARQTASPINTGYFAATVNTEATSTLEGSHVSDGIAATGMNRLRDRADRLHRAADDALNDLQRAHVRHIVQVVDSAGFDVGAICVQPSSTPGGRPRVVDVRMTDGRDGAADPRKHALDAAFTDAFDPYRAAPGYTPAGRHPMNTPGVLDIDSARRHHAVHTSAAQERPFADQATDRVDALIADVCDPDSADETHVADLIADLHHWCRARGASFDDLNDQALGYVAAESDDAQDGEQS